MRTLNKGCAAHLEEVSLEIFTLPKGSIKNGDIVEFLGIHENKDLKELCDLEPGKRYVVKDYTLYTRVPGEICQIGRHKSKRQPEERLCAIKVEGCLDYWNVKYFKVVKNGGRV
ncbi:hypothetical protein HY498_03325 [Candidatus Woesearchaeota archaeon]|nr:hypothetical protein [Candidatus Woesearchaeota archaeon]